MGKGDRKKPAAPGPIFPTRDQIINAYQTYAGRTPEEDEIRSHLGNPGGIAAVIIMLQRDSPIVIPDPIPLPTPMLPPISSASSEPKLIAEHCNPIGMAYWRCINNHTHQNVLKVVITLDNSLHIFTIDKSTLSVLNIEDLQINDTGEQVYFSAVNSTRLYIREESELYQLDIETGERIVMMTPPAGMRLWQCHSSWDDNTHSATLQDSNYRAVAWGVKTPFGFKQYPIIGDPDECQVDKSGMWLVAKENDNNRIIQLSNDREYIISDKEGAVGHSDTGFGYVIGENNQIGACVRWQLGSPGLMTIIYGPNVWNMGYISMTNSRPSASIDQQKGLLSLPDRLVSVKLDGSGSRDICSTLTQSQKYEHRAKANLCPLGQYAVWTALVDGQLNAYIVRIPEW